MGFFERGHINTREQRGQEDTENSVAEALRDAGLDPRYAPRPGTEAYYKLEQAATQYITAVVNSNRPRFVERYGIAVAEESRRGYHNELCMLLFGKWRKECSTQAQDMASNFAAYLTNHSEYINTW